MGKKKLIKYAAAKELPNVLQPGVLDFKAFVLESFFNPDYFGNSHPITAELGCGKGEFTVNLARKYPERNFIGIDIKSDRMLHGARTALTEGLSNVCFVRIRIECLAAYFPKHLFSEGFITFPDPHVSNENGKRRLTSRRFLSLYKEVFAPGSRIHLKTDSETLYTFSKDSIPENGASLIHYTDDLYCSTHIYGDITTVLTTYEKRYLSRSKTIKYILFSI
jgi:tRNA (guanine-N7-)-methyltransferase